jgi:hypothetical protein
VDIVEVLEAIADAVGDAQAQLDPPLTTTWWLPDSVNPPHLYLVPPEIDFDKTFKRGIDQVQITARLLVSAASDEPAARFLEAFRSGSGARSIKAALVAARGEPGQPALGGAGGAHDIHASRWREPRWFEHSALTYLGCELEIQVMGAGS